MRTLVVLFAAGLFSGCVTTAAAPGSAATPAAVWKWAGAEVAIVGRPAGVVFEREGAPMTAGSPRRERLTARCLSCVPIAHIEFEATTPVVPYELNAGIAEVITAQVVFPAEGTWAFEPFAGQITARAATSSQPAVVIVRPWSAPLSADCGPPQIERAVTSLAQAFNTGDPSGLGRALNPGVDFSITAAPLAPFVTQKRDEVGDHIRARFLAGERIYPYLVYAGAVGNSAVDLAIYFVRIAPDLPPSASGYRRAFAGSRLSCSDLLLARFNADLLRD